MAESRERTRLQVAFERLNERKEAALGDDPDTPVIEEGMKALLLFVSGFGIDDVDELLWLRGQVMHHAAEALAAGTDPLKLIGALWLDGFLTGDLYEQAKGTSAEVQS